MDTTTRSIMFEEHLDTIISERMILERRTRSAQVVHMLEKLLRIEAEQDLHLCNYGGTKNEDPNDTNTP